MKKVNLCLTESDAIDGFNNISIAQVDSVPNGSIDNIVINILNNVDYEESKNLLIKSLKKLKNKGMLTITIIDVIGVSKDIFYGSITSKSVSSIFSGKRSLVFEEDIIDVVNNFPQFKIKNRYKNQNNLVLVVYKELKNE